MIDLKAVEIELAQARRARMEAELAGCEVEELADNLRQTHAAWLFAQARRRTAAPHRLVFSA